MSEWEGWAWQVRAGVVIRDCEYRPSFRHISLPGSNVLRGPRTGEFSPSFSTCLAVMAECGVVGCAFTACPEFFTLAPSHASLVFFLVFLFSALDLEKHVADIPLTFFFFPFLFISRWPACLVVNVWNPCAHAVASTMPYTPFFSWSVCV